MSAVYTSDDGNSQSTTSEEALRFASPSQLYNAVLLWEKEYSDCFITHILDKITRCGLTISLEDGGNTLTISMPRDWMYDPGEEGFHWIQDVRRHSRRRSSKSRGILEEARVSILPFRVIEDPLNGLLEEGTVIWFDSSKSKVLNSIEFGRSDWPGHIHDFLESRSVEESEWRLNCISGSESEFGRKRGEDEDRLVTWTFRREEDLRDPSIRHEVVDYDPAFWHDGETDEVEDGTGEKVGWDENDDAPNEYEYMGDLDEMVDRCTLLSMIT